MTRSSHPSVPPAQGRGNETTLEKRGDPLNPRGFDFKWPESHTSGLAGNWLWPIAAVTAGRVWTAFFRVRRASPSWQRGHELSTAMRGIAAQLGLAQSSHETRPRRIG
jgi:hypothetical protein